MTPGATGDGPDWAAAYANYDDASLGALASAGLLRRAAKDVEAGKVAWSGPDGAREGAVLADGQSVRLARQGPGSCRCDCPAAGMCKHIVAAALWLRTQARSGAREHDESACPDVDNGLPVIPARVDVLAEVLALDFQQLFKTAGVAAVRKAATLLDTVHDADIRVQDAVLVVALPSLDLVCRYVAGAGFDGMVSEAHPRERKTVHLLAIGLAWRRHGRQVDWPASAMPAVPAEGLTSDERALLARIRHVVHELCAAGWSHVGDHAAAQLRALATSAHIESFPRLSGLLRSLAGTTALLAARDFGADERQALGMAARIEVIASALEHADAVGDAALLERLRGAARRVFNGEETLELLPLGAYWWERRTGARGLTVAFWDAAARQVRQAVLARPDGRDPMFSRLGAWTTSALWPGAGVPSSFAGNTLLLAHPRLADDGRLALGGDTRASVQPAWTLDDARWQAAGFDDWTALRDAVVAGTGLLSEQNDLLLLRPSSCRLARLDKAQQDLVWPVRDRHGEELVLRLPYGRSTARRFDALAGWAASGTRIVGVLAKLSLRADGHALEPVSIVVERDAIACAVSPEFQPSPTQIANAGRIAVMLDGRRAPPPVLPRSATQQLLHTVLAVLERRAMLGHLHLAGADDDLRAPQVALRALGLDTLATSIERYLSNSGMSTTLTLYRLAQTYVELDTASLRT